MFTINKKNVWDLPNSFIQVIFDQDKVLPSEESFDLFKEPHKFRDFLIELNLYVRGGMVEHYEAVFEDMRKLVTSPSSFHKKGILDIPEDDCVFIIVYIRHNDGDRQIETVQLLLDQKYAIYTKSTVKDAKIHTFMVNGEQFDLGILSEEDRNKVIQRYLGQGIHYNF